MPFPSPIYIRRRQITDSTHVRKCYSLGTDMKISLREIIVYVWKEHADDSFAGTPGLECI